MASGQLGDFRHDPDPGLRALADLPQEVRVHIDRAINCNHWAGEEPYDKARGREIARALRSLRCDKLNGEAKRLRRRYARAPSILAAIEKYAPLND